MDGGGVGEVVVGGRVGSCKRMGSLGGGELGRLGRFDRGLNNR